MRTLAVGEAWGQRGLVPAGCDKCQEVHLVEAAWVGIICPACCRGKLEAMPGQLVSEPERVVGFDVTPNGLAKLFEPFVHEVPMRTGDLDAKTLAARAVAVWWPMWLVDAELQGHWSADAGFNYETKSSRESFTAGKWKTEEVTDIRIRWEDRVGTVKRQYDNVPIPGMAAYKKLQELVGTTDLTRAVPASDSIMGNGAVRLPDVSPEAAWPTAEEAIRQAASEECGAALSADHMRDYTLFADHDKLNWTWLLVPAYSSWYRDGSGKRHRILVNGQTGEIGGKRWSSMSKAVLWSGFWLTIAAVSLGCIGLLALVGLVAPPLLVLSAMLLFIPLAVSILALFPVIRAWSWNRAQ